MKLKVIQTVDGVSPYNTLLDVTGHVNRQYCERHGYAYETYRGLKHGIKPWHACFNRIFMLLDEIERQEYDWILYLDADCYVADVAYPATRIIEEAGGNYGLLMAGGAGPDYGYTHDVNTGVIFVNVRNQYAKSIITIWRELCVSILNDEKQNRNVEPFKLGGGPNNLVIADQPMMIHTLIIYYHFGELKNAVKTYLGAEYNKFNYNGDFIKQLLRPNYGTDGTKIEDRIETAKAHVKDVVERFGLLPLPPALQPVPVPEIDFRAAYARPAPVPVAESEPQATAKATATATAEAPKEKPRAASSNDTRRSAVPPMFIGF
jgi:hypothetical protein